MLFRSEVEGERARVVNDPLASMIQGISISEDASFFATVSTDSNVSVWSLAEKRKITSFKALWSLGRHRLCCTNMSKPIIATGSWERGKAAAYDAITGQNLWIVTLSHVQLIAPISHLGSLQLGFSTDDKGVQIRDPFTGAYLKNVRGARYFFSSQDRKHFALVTRRKKIRFCQADGDVLGETFLISFAALEGPIAKLNFCYQRLRGRLVASS